ncbi:hypothetical protein M9458_050526, partial [Cirrhinus mrigala]
MSTETPAATDPLTELVNAFKAAFQPTPSPPSASGSPMAMPATFTGEAAECSQSVHPQQFPSENAIDAFLISLLTGKALQWAKAIWNSDNPIIHSYEQFTSHFSVTNTATGTLTASDQLFRLQQGTSSVNDYTLHFCTLAAVSGWNEIALLGAYRQGLNPEIRAAMALYDDSIGLESFLQRTTRVSQQLATCQPPITAPQSASVAASFPVPEPMQIDTTRLSRTERNRRILMGLCLYCGQSGHLICTCPVRPPCPVVSTISTEVETTDLLPVTLHTSDYSISVSVLVDSGSSCNFISQDSLNQLQLSRRHHFQVFSVKNIQGKPLWHGAIRYSSPFITLQVRLFHKEEIRFLVLEDSTNSAGNLVTSSAGVNNVTLNASSTYHTLNQFQFCCLLPVESPEPSFTPEIPAEYTVFQDVFSKQAATHLPPHRPWDCAIELLPGAQLPKGRIYPLSILECQAMEEYIAEALSQGFIQPSTSPAASSFFFVCKKAESLCPCIDYRQLNSQIIQQPYPLPLVPAALEELRGARVFTKLDLRSAPSIFQTFMNEVFREFLHLFVVVYPDDILIYSRNLAEHRQHVQQVLHKLCEHSLYLKLEKCEFHQPSVQFLGYVINAEGVQMDQGKVSAIQEWPQPHTVKELQRFLGFSNFYRRFIKNYSSITAPLTSLLRVKPKNLTWNPAAHEAFQRLKNIFSTATLLHHPDPELPFMVEVDASTSGVGAVLSQVVGEPPLLHSCAFYSRKLSPVQQNYDVGNRELLAIKLALEEWRHWLEGAAHEFTIITDHKNLQYLREARRLNPRQARLALFFTRFNFKIPRIFLPMPSL